MYAHEKGTGTVLLSSDVKVSGPSSGDASADRKESQTEKKENKCGLRQIGPDSTLMLGRTITVP